VGLGLSGYIPLAIYCLTPIAVFLTLFIRAEVGLFFLVPLIPMTSVLEKLNEYPFGKDFVDVMVVAIIIGTFIQRRFGAGDAPGARINKVMFLLVALNIVALIRGNLFLDEAGAIQEGRIQVLKNFLLMPIFYYLTLRNIRTRRELLILLVLTAVSIMAMAVNFRNTFVWVKSYHYSHDMRIGGMLRYLGPNELGAFFAQYGCMLAGIALCEKKKMMKAILSVGVCLCLYVAMYSFSRSAYLAVFVVSVFFAVVWKRKLLIPIVVFLLAWRIVLPVSVVERIDMTFMQEEVEMEVAEERGAISVGGSKVDSVGRKQLWETAFEIFLRNPLFGTGYNTFASIAGGDAHNQYLKTLAEQGVVGFGVFIWFLVAAYREGMRKYRESSDDFSKGLGLGFGACTLAVMVGNITGDHWSYYNLMSFYWIYLAMIVGSGTLSGEVISESLGAREKDDENGVLVGGRWSDLVGRVFR